jgi:hypothetical protein
MTYLGWGVSHFIDVSLGVAIGVAREIQLAFVQRPLTLVSFELLGVVNLAFFWSRGG